MELLGKPEVQIQDSQFKVYIAVHNATVAIENNVEEILQHPSLKALLLLYPGVLQRHLEMLKEGCRLLDISEYLFSCHYLLHKGAKHMRYWL